MIRVKICENKLTIEFNFDYAIEMQNTFYTFLKGTSVLTTRDN